MKLTEPAPSGSRARAERDVAKQIEEDQLVRERPREVEAALRGLRMSLQRGSHHQLHPAAEAALHQDCIARALTALARSGANRSGLFGSQWAARIECWSRREANSWAINGPQAKS